MSSRAFGSRGVKPLPEAERVVRVERCSKIDFVRAVVAATIEQYAFAPENQRAGLAVRVRTLQDQLSSLKHRYPLSMQKSSALEWVDTWRPD